MGECHKVIPELNLKTEIHARSPSSMSLESLIIKLTPSASTFKGRK